MHLQESGEMYLETILILTRQTGSVRSVDVGEYMGYSKPSVSRAMALLRSGGFCAVDGEGRITLTPAGSAVAEKIYERHTILAALLTRLGVDEETAASDACKIEHDLSDTSFAAIKACVERLPGAPLPPSAD